MWKKLGLSDHAMKKTVTDGEVLKFYTVGDGSVQTIIDEYTSAGEAFKKADETSQINSEKFSYFWLDVPMDKSGTKPYQALINFGAKKSKDMKSVKYNTDEVVKIQIAAPVEGLDDALPMLLYNSNRSAKTFIHPEEDGYQKIRSLIQDSGSEGSLGKTGGTKAYFHCKILKSQGVIAVKTSSVAPVESW